MQFLLFLLLWCFALPSFVASAIQHTSAIQIQSGSIRGQLTTLSTGDVIRKYLGIPFAKAKRFENPEPPDSWPGIRNMTSLGKACYQSPRSAPFGAVSQDISEDCLDLSVYVPDSVGAVALPVMVWIHGAGYRANSGRNYDGSYLASLGKVIVVTINYRLYAFGFLATGNGSSDLKGNYGMMDQVQALKWVKKNIKVFGGDHTRVTIFGNSAGGASVSLLCLSPLGKDLFKYAIIQSGTANAAMSFATYDDVAEAAKNFSRKLNCSDFGNIKSCLQNKTSEEILKEAIVVRAHNFGSPIIDGHFLPDSPKVLLEKGKFHCKNILVGVAEDDGSCFTNAIPELSPAVNITIGLNRQDFISYITGGWRHYAELTRSKSALAPPVTTSIIYRYTDWANITDRFRNRRMYLDVITDKFFIAPTIVYANAFVKHGSKAYFYQVEYQLKQGVTPRLFNVPSWLTTYHEAEKFMVFGYPFMINNTSSDLLHTTDANVSRSVIEMWTNFAKTGNPNNQGTNVWPEYDLNQQQYLALKPHMEVKSKLRADRMAFWNVFLPKLKNVLYHSCQGSSPKSNSQLKERFMFRLFGK